MIIVRLCEAKIWWCGATSVPRWSL
jgi:hypothetical protein